MIKLISIIILLTILGCASTKTYVAPDYKNDTNDLSLNIDIIDESPMISIENIDDSLRNAISNSDFIELFKQGLLKTAKLQTTFKNLKTNKYISKNIGIEKNKINCKFMPARGTRFIYNEYSPNVILFINNLSVTCFGSNKIGGGPYMDPKNGVFYNGGPEAEMVAGAGIKIISNYFLWDNVQKREISCGKIVSKGEGFKDRAGYSAFNSAIIDYIIQIFGVTAFSKYK